MIGFVIVAIVLSGCKKVEEDHLFRKVDSSFSQSQIHLEKREMFPNLDKEVILWHNLPPTNENDEHPIPLRKDGLGGAQEMMKIMKELTDEKERSAFEEAFRLTFSIDKTKRDPKKAREICLTLIDRHPDFSGSFRVLGYLELSDHFNVEAALKNYEKATQLKDEYAEAHYALASLYLMKDPFKGFQHYKKAMFLGLKDAMNLGQFYER